MTQRVRWRIVVCLVVKYDGMLEVDSDAGEEGR